jgi:hypothetical protein
MDGPLHVCNLVARLSKGKQLYLSLKMLLGLRLFCRVQNRKI